MSGQASTRGEPRRPVLADAALAVDAMIDFDADDLDRSSYVTLHETTLHKASSGAQTLSRSVQR